MKFISLILVALSPLVVSSSPVSLNNNPTGNAVNDTTLLNFALILGSFQSVFYDQGLSQFDDQAFQNAGFGTNIRSSYAQINQNKRTQLAFLNQTLGENATTPCTFNFQFENVTNFTTLSQIVENIGVSVYIGSAQNLTNATYQTAAASILANSARYASWIASVVNNVEPWDGAFDVPLTLNQTTTLLAPYVTSCPSNHTDSFVPSPSLQISTGAAGSNVTFTFDNSTSPSENSSGSSNNTGETTFFAAFFQGLSQIFVPLNSDTATVPSNLTGIVYAVVTNSSTRVSEDTTVAGPAILNLSVPSNSTNSSDSGTSTSTVSSATSTEFPSSSTTASSN